MLTNDHSCTNSVEKQLALYDEYKAKFPKAQSPQRLQLDVAQGDTFKSLLDAYMQKSMRKGIPPLFVGKFQLNYVQIPTIKYRKPEYRNTE